MNKTNMLFVMTGTIANPGGIATVNQNILYALIELVKEDKIKLTVFSYLEKYHHRPSFLPNQISFRAYNGNKIKLSIDILKFYFKKPIYFFERVGLAATALPLIFLKSYKSIIFAHGSENWSTKINSESKKRRYNQNVRKIDLLSIKAAACCIANSNFTLKKMRERIDKLNGVVCTLGLSTEFDLNMDIPQNKFRIELEDCEGKTRLLASRVILLVGRMDSREREKGHYALIKIMPKLLTKFPDVQLVFAGPGDDKNNLVKLTQRMNIGSSVFIPGYVPITLLKNLYNQSYVFAMPSKQEGFGLVYLEAMNYGKPCVGCFDDGAEDIIVHNETGFLLNDPDNSQELSNILNLVFSDREYAKKLGEAGFQRLHSNFTSKHFQNRLKDEIEKVLN